MKYLIRFEDMYGLADIFCKAYGLKYVEVTSEPILVSENLYVWTGLGAIKSLYIKSPEQSIYCDLGIDIVITVFDMDSLDTQNSNPLSSSEFTRRIIKKYNNIEYRWMPVRWCAETCMLLSELRMAVSLVNDSTWKYHVVLLAILHDVSPAVKAKVFRDYLVDSDIATIKQLADGPVRELLTDYTTCGYTIEETCSILDKYCVDFYKYLDNITYFDLCGVRLSNHDSLYVNKSRFKNFPNTFK